MPKPIWKIGDPDSQRPDKKSSTLTANGLLPGGPFYTQHRYIQI
jgi:hypothetical protein